MSNTTSTKYYKVAVLVYDGADILDFTGPIEVLSRALHHQNLDDINPIFEIQTIAQHNFITTASLKIEADFLLADARETITKYDMLLVPGASQTTIKKLVDINTPELDLIRRYASGESKRPRIILSVCTGASLLGAAGILSGITVTTHRRALDLLRETCSQTLNYEESNILSRRFVDGGLLKGANVRVISSGGKWRL
ncbi:hypothetical protein N7495_003185 [Penicillium taxi]|uniref:uncharacterized protein n=1 Tax=Penicillium taxi TaxID=168475 RepID=UPI0025451A6A|nr:uncharacterized protein N7495_003185 [Penicillium taxi]KAJ5902657.1 hypothetical protein N7495_003185 [Penicillium taxi]